MKTAKKVTAFVLAVFAFFGAGILAVHAQATDQFGISYGGYTGLTNVDIRVTIANIIRIALGLLGTIALLIVLYGGFLYMTAAGNEDQIGRAKNTLKAGIIGLLIIASAFAIVSFIISRLLEAVQGGPTGGTGGLDDSRCIGLSATCPAGALGNGIIESTYPTRGQTNVPRNTRIFITFKEKIKPESLVVGGATSTVAIIKSSQVVNTSNQFLTRFAQSLTAADIQVVSAGDGKTFGFIQTNCSADTPDLCIGSPSEKLFYTVALRGGSDGIKKADNSAAFVGVFSAGYAWEFQVSTVLDLTPPQVSFVVPNNGSADNPRNSLIQVNFNKPVDPISVGQGMTVTYSDATHAPGTVLKGVQDIGNGYSSVEFHTNDACGVNSCGETIYCLPGNATLDTTVKADGLAKAPTGVYPPNGVTDMSGNSLDGNKNGKAEGPPTDNYPFTFKTNDTIDLKPPTITATGPNVTNGGATGDVPRDLPITATFSKLMSTTSIRSDSAQLVPGAGGAPTNYWALSQPVAAASGTYPTQTTGIIAHDLMSKDQPYSTNWTSALRDTHQNCFYPGNGKTFCTGSEPFCCNGRPQQTPCAF